MLKAVVVAASSLLLLALPVVVVQQNAVAQGAAAPVDAALMEKGKKLFEDNCAECHDAAGTGMPPDFPVLVGNGRLGDLQSIVRNIRKGQGPMPAFADLTADDIAAVATYIRNAWTNKVGGVTAQQVTAALDAVAKEAPQISVWDRVYTVAQATRGRTAYSAVCAKCHGRTANGTGDPDQPKSPALARDAFLRKWEGRTLASLFEYVRTQMPQDNPNSRPDQEIIDAIAHLLMLSTMPAGAKDLAADPVALSTFVIKRTAQ
jgi:mono/diheme cytochrome c family protein